MIDEWKLSISVRLCCYDVLCQWRFNFLYQRCWPTNKSLNWAFPSCDALCPDASTEHPSPDLASWSILTSSCSSLLSLLSPTKDNFFSWEYLRDLLIRKNSFTRNHSVFTNTFVTGDCEVIRAGPYQPERGLPLKVDYNWSTSNPDLKPFNILQLKRRFILSRSSLRVKPLLLVCGEVCSSCDSGRKAKEGGWETPAAPVRQNMNEEMWLLKR